MIRRAGIGLMIVALLTVSITVVFQREIGERIYALGVAQRIADRGVELPDGLHVALCGTGSPMPDLARGGPCIAVLAGEEFYVVDVGDGGARRLNLMGFDLGTIDGVFLTHFHSDHIDGLGPLALYRWTMGNRQTPLPVFGPPGVEEITGGLNLAYRQDKAFRTAHHGIEIAPPTGAGLIAIPFPAPEKARVVLKRKGLTVTAFPVDHAPVRPALGYRFDYKDRSVVLSGDTVRSASLERAAAGADLLIHEVLQPRLVKELTRALDDNGEAATASITRDILTYHATPEDAARSAAASRVGQLIFSHIIPPLPSRFFNAALRGDANDFFEGPITVGEDGMIVSLPAGSETVEINRRF